MPRTEKLLERPLRRPLDEETRRAIESEYKRRRHEIPIPTELKWHATHPQFTIRSPLLSFIVNFTADERLVVDAELSMAARLMASDANRKQAVQFIESIAVDLGL
jgi:hypothetical protein